VDDVDDLKVIYLEPANPGGQAGGEPPGIDIVDVEWKGDRITHGPI
jgi:hypothetical protein